MNSIKLLLVVIALASCATLSPTAEGTIQVTFDPEAPAIVQVVPYYPEIAEASRLSGKVELTYVVSDRGLPEQVKVQSSTDSIFHDSAIHAIQNSRYFPKDGETFFSATVRYSAR